MKKRIIIQIMCLLVCFCMCSCGKGKEASIVPYSVDKELKTDVYVDIISVYPVYSITGDGYYAVCKCLTSTGEYVWLSISQSDYKETFDENAQFSSTSFSSESLTAVMVQGRLYGTVQSTDAEFQNIKDSFGIRDIDVSERIGSERILNYTAFVPEEFDADAASIREAAFSNECIELMPVYADVVSAQPMYYALNIFDGKTSYYCLCEAEDGCVFWMYLSEDACNSMEEAIDADGSCRITGHTRLVADFCDSDVQEEMNADLIVIVDESQFDSSSAE